MPFNYCIYITDYSLDNDKKQSKRRESLNLIDVFKITATVGG